MKNITLFILLFSFYNSFAQENLKVINFTGNLGYDQKIAEKYVSTELQDDNNIKIGEMKKSVWGSAGLSLLVPGAGQFYNEEAWWKTALFVAVEATAIYVGLAYDKKGDDQTASFQAFANHNWDVARYATFTIDNIKRLKPGASDEEINKFNNTLFYDSERKNVNWDVLNELETYISGYYSHRLERYGRQQYYEMIGKYPQFNPGWSDFNDPDYTYGRPLTDNFHYYSGERGKANDYYNVASKAVVILVVNHFISAAEAALYANSYNKKLKINLSLEQKQIGLYSEYTPKLNLQVRF